MTNRYEGWKFQQGKDEFMKIIGTILNSKEKDMTPALDFIIQYGFSIGTTDIDIKPLPGVGEKLPSFVISYKISGRNTVLAIIEADIETDNGDNIYRGLVTLIGSKAGMRLDWRNPADGRLSWKIDQINKESSYRCNMYPTVAGYKVALRAFATKVIRLDDIDIGKNDKALLRDAIKKTGLLICSGPTGSGKTTLLYALLSEINALEKSISTIENPVESLIYGVAHSQVSEDASDVEKRYTFGKALKSLMRQTPDVIMVGEIRDEETADSAVLVGQSGHLVLTTTHAENIANTPQKILSLGVSVSNFLSATKVLVAQRLTEKLCPHCSKPTKISPEVEEKIRKNFGHLMPFIQKMGISSIRHRNDDGCEHCTLGFKGRNPLIEVFRVDDQFKKILASGGDSIFLTKYFDTLRKQEKGPAFLSIEDKAVFAFFQGLIDEEVLLPYIN